MQASARPKDEFFKKVEKILPAASQIFGIHIHPAQFCQHGIFGIAGIAIYAPMTAAVVSPYILCGNAPAKLSWKCPLRKAKRKLKGFCVLPLEAPRLKIGAKVFYKFGINAGRGPDFGGEPGFRRRNKQAKGVGQAPRQAFRLIPCRRPKVGIDSPQVAFRLAVEIHKAEYKPAGKGRDLFGKPCYPFRMTATSRPAPRIIGSWRQISLSRPKRSGKPPECGDAPGKRRQTGLKIFRNIVVNGEVKAELQAHVLNAAQMRQKGLGIFAPENNQPAFFETDILALRWVEKGFSRGSSLRRSLFSSQRA